MTQNLSQESEWFATIRGAKIPKIEAFPPIEKLKKSRRDYLNKILDPVERKKANKKAREEYIYNLNNQRLAWAACRIEIQDRIDRDLHLKDINKHVTRLELLEIVSKYAVTYGFTKEQVVTAQKIIFSFDFLRAKIYEIRNQFPNDIDLINHITGRKFTQDDKDDFEIVMTPYAIEIICSEGNAQKIDNETEQTSDEVFLSEGFADYSILTGVRYSVIIRQKDKDQQRVVQIHEREHHINYFLQLIYTLYKFSQTFLKEIKNELKIVDIQNLTPYDISIIPQFLGEEYGKRFGIEYLFYIRWRILNKAKNEFIAQIKGIYLKRELEGKGKKYAYWESKRYRHFWNDPEYDFPQHEKVRKKEYTDQIWCQWGNTEERVLVHEYELIIGKTIKAFENLMETEYSCREVIAIFQDVHFSQWPKTVERLLKYRDDNEK